MTPLSRPYSTDGRILYIDGPLGEPMCGRVRHRIGALLRGGERQIVLDMTGVTSIDAAGIGELVRAYNMARAVEGTLHVANPSARARRAIERAGLSDFLLPPRVTRE